jgi:uncharacterized protein (UPF0333 family)
MDIRKDAQISLEYMVLIGFITLTTIPLILIYYTFTQESGDEISAAQVNQIGKRIVEAAESVYYLGEPSQTTLRVNIPGQIKSAGLSDYEVVFNVTTNSGIAEIVQSSSVNITGTLPLNKGTYTLTIKAESNGVKVSYK